MADSQLSSSAKPVANLHDEYGFMLLDDGIFSFLGGQVGVFILQLLRGDKGYLAAQLGCDAGVFFLYDFERITDCKTVRASCRIACSLASQKSLPL